MSGRSFSIPIQSTSERSSTKTALPPWANSLLDRHTLPIGHAPNAEPPHQKESHREEDRFAPACRRLTAIDNVAAQETNAPASKVTKIFDRELPNVPGKRMVQCSLNTVQVPRRPHIVILPRPSSMQPCWKVRFVARSTTSPSMSTRQEKAGRRCPATTTR